MLLIAVACVAPPELGAALPTSPAPAPSPTPATSPAPATSPTKLTSAGPPPPSVPGAGGLVLNELMPRNDSTVMETPGEFPDWFELYNGTDEAIALDRVRVRTPDGDWTGTADDELAAGAVLLVTGGLTIDADGDFVDLVLDGEIVDSVATGAVAGDTTWARYPDGGAWTYSALATPGWSNGRTSTAGTDPSAVFFREDDIEDVYLTLSDTSWAQLSGDPYTEVPGTFAWRGAWFPEVNVRRKGVYGSLRNLDQKAAFKVDVGDYDRRVRGLETLSLNNMVQDPTYVHEALTYALYRAVGVPAPRVGYARVYVNETWFGLYAQVETVDDTFLARWFADPTGDLYEGAYGVDFYSGYESSFECDDCADPTDRSDLTAVIDVLNRTADADAWEDLQALVDMDAFLLYMAVEAATWHWDGYTTSNNYRVYLNPRDGRFTMIPWGTDQTWVDEWYGPFDARGRIFQWCLTWTPCEEAYLEALHDVADVVDATDFAGQAESILALLDEDIDQDPRKEWSESTRADYLRRTYVTIATTAERIRTAADTR